MSEKDVHSIIVTDDARFRILTTRALITLELAGINFNTLLAGASLLQVKCIKSPVTVSDVLMMLEGSYSQHLFLSLVFVQTALSLKHFFQNEQRWKAVLEGAHQGVWDWNARTSKIYFSPIWNSCPCH